MSEKIKYLATKYFRPQTFSKAHEDELIFRVVGWLGEEYPEQSVEDIYHNGPKETETQRLRREEEERCWEEEEIRERQRQLEEDEEHKRQEERITKNKLFHLEIIEERKLEEKSLALRPQLPSGIAFERAEACWPPDDLWHVFDWPCLRRDDDYDF